MLERKDQISPLKGGIIYSDKYLLLPVSIDILDYILRRIIHMRVGRILRTRAMVAALIMHPLVVSQACACFFLKTLFLDFSYYFLG